MLSKLMGAAALAAMTCAGPALAAPAGNDAGKELVEARVKHSDLNLTSQTDLARLKQRIERRANRLCTTGFGFARIDQAMLACRAEVIASGAAQIDRAVAVAMLRQAKARKG